MGTLNAVPLMNSGQKRRVGGLQGAGLISMLVGTLACAMIEMPPTSPPPTLSV